MAQRGPSYSKIGPKIHHFLDYLAILPDFRNEKDLILILPDIFRRFRYARNSCLGKLKRTPTNREHVRGTLLRTTHLKTSD